ncbi:MAG: class I adenylate-forming enzyme family protein [Acidimicrobiales bacterium]
MTPDITLDDPDTFAGVVRAAGARYGDRPLYVMPDGASFSYGELDTWSESVAAGLARRGVAEGDAVVLLLPSGPAYAICYAALAKIGAVTAGVNDKLSPPERRACVELSRPRLVIASDTLAAESDLEDAEVVLTGDGVGAASLDALRSTGEVPLLDRAVDRPVAIVFTSGTTGAPKGAVFGDRQLNAISFADGMRRWGGGGRGLASTSFAHLGYMTKLPQVLRGGGTTFVMGKWSARTALEMVERHAITTLGGIPTQVALMLRHERFATTDHSSVRLIALGGGPATPALVREARSAFGVPVLMRYTCTEAGVGVGTLADDPPEDAEQTVGRARAGVSLTVRDEPGSVLPDGEIGEVCLASDAVMTGYWRDRDATAAAFTEDGAVRTGDLGYVDEQGRLHLVGRAKEMYVRGGYNVFPLEVESVLEEHPAVAHVAVAPRPDPVMGEIGVAVVVVRSGSGAELTLESLRDFGRTHLAAHKLPEALVFVEELPRTAMEKIDRRALAALVGSR